ncbi:uncharacterized protein (DUF58 family) [Acinetobacter baylyi]|uniref:Uncharacterized protein (DUF58 family) n=1 Tax=Acinetobacter baylyi TaxID=202950 RepID=A0ABU0V166_ACIBI|nr:DUF58 domain-containing protein [Acinetobacter baylyi]MDQ1210573.1 uncharacterized protein (DUF58 family) [Acinetobacter baylyi]MDR6105832.1 uncharacterized protein (DUF58 family) [Acinetobacter baylyi]MDR6187449.1 uncharacterized protein (DUF58 family) [Acinetobacter baylyi]
MQFQFQQWFAQRFEVAHLKTLGQREILIFVHQQGFLYLILILITFVAGINYANNLILGFCFLISAVFCTSFYLTFKQLHQLQIEIYCPEVGELGQHVVIKILIKQQEPISRYLQIKAQNQLYQIRVDQKQQQIELVLEASKRGKFELPRIQIFSTYPFGLVRAWTYLSIQQEIWIAPQALALMLEQQYLAHVSHDEIEEFRELRAFQEGDSLQAVSWKHMARGQGLFIKVFENQRDQHVVEIDYARIPCGDHEQKLRWMMALIGLCEQQQRPFSLYLPKQQLESDLSEAHSILARKLLAQA